MPKLVDQRGVQVGWQQYLEARKNAPNGQATLTLRDELIMRYASLVGYVAGRLAVTLPSSIDKKDLEQVGAIGLIKSVEAYVPQPDVDFEAYALGKIRGHILDHLRNEDFLPRSARKTVKEIERTLSGLIQTLGRNPTEVEAAQACGMTLAEYKSNAEMLSYKLVSLDTLLTGTSGERRGSLADMLSSDTAIGPEQHALENALSGELAAAVGKLPEREREILSFYYHNELTQAEIAKIMNVSESRVSQLHTQAMTLMRAHLHAARSRLVSV